MTALAFVDPKSLTQTKEVLKQREKLEVIIRRYQQKYSKRS